MHTVVFVEACVCVFLCFIYLHFKWKSSAYAQQVLNSNTSLSVNMCVFQVSSVFCMQFLQCASVIVCMHTDMYTVSICRAI